MSLFDYDAAVTEAFPTITAGAVLLRGATNPPSSSELVEMLVAEQAAARERIGSTPLAELPSIAAWRKAFSAFGVSPTKYRNAAEALLRRITRKGDLPTISTLVDLGNLVSIRCAVPVFVVDLDRIDKRLVVRVATGNEIFDDLGGTDANHPQPGEVVFVDASDAVAARRWCWRQSRASAVTADTRNVLMVAEAHHSDGRTDVEVAAQTFAALARELMPAVIGDVAVLDAANPSAF